VHLCLANIFVGAKHDRCKSLVITNKLSAVMLRLCRIGMLPVNLIVGGRNLVFYENTQVEARRLGKNPVSSIEVRKS